MKRTRSIAMLAALALAATLTACSEGADSAESAPSSDGGSARQSDQPTQSPTLTDDEAPEPDQQIVAYRLDLDYYREMVGAFAMRVVEAVIDDGTVVEFKFNV